MPQTPISRFPSRSLFCLACLVTAIGMAQAQVTEVVLHDFAEMNINGLQPAVSVVRDKAGNLYGTTPYSGLGGLDGLVFKIDTRDHIIILHRFTGGTDGRNPQGSVVLDVAGNLYGTTCSGGTAG